MKDNNNTKNIWMKLIPFINVYKISLLKVFILMILTAIGEIVLTYQTKIAINDFIKPLSTEGLNIFVLRYVLIVFLLMIVVFLFIREAGIIEVGLVHDIRKSTFEKLQKLAIKYHDENAVGWIMSRMMSDTQKLGDFLSWGFVDLVWGFSMMVGIVIVLVNENLRLAVITLSVVPVLALVTFYFQRKIIKLQRNVRKQNSIITGAISENITSAKTTKTLVIEDDIISDFKEKTLDMRVSSIRSSIFSSLLQPLVINLGVIGTIFAIYYGGNEVVTGTLSLGSLVIFINYSVQFFEPVREAARVLTEMQSAQVSVERIFMLLESEETLTDSDEVISKFGTIFSPNTKEYPNLIGSVEFDNVGFSYSEDNHILKDFNLKIDAGSSIAIVGPTGSGKSTIVNLICRFYEPTSGRLKIDGIDYKEKSQNWLHSNIGYVLQTPHLFSGTIGENIKYGNEKASMEDVVASAKYVNAHDFIMTLPNGYDTEVGEGGCNLSHGQKQLLSFARAILVKPRIFVLDEATSSIDTENEVIIQSALEKLLENRTSFIIAHRLSTIKSCDRILVVEDGVISEDGNFDELIREKGKFYDLCMMEHEGVIK